VVATMANNAGIAGAALLSPEPDAAASTRE
jgi:hypothetical protein